MNRMRQILNNERNHWRWREIGVDSHQGSDKWRVDWFGDKLISKEMPFYLPLSVQDDFFLFQRIIFIISTILNITSLICLFKQTPPHQATFKNYVILIQVLLTLSDINLDILFAPIPLFPLPAGYCVGLLCRAKVPMRLQLVLTTTFVQRFHASSRDQQFFSLQILELQL
ncbi:hypothetical protein PRIPAC_80836 [Pristionchus pacificus]|uniref:G protein-coupled receptor n=1 Tax=Pristionchus pacificus TaxID=54126 RepID=A0A2A6C2J9_PRIPA|nr:hypothetical protein PRIPAC_80836 [Pristionchus pacificus]|eukprot:PDM72370.1 G protein-coupled receptor [Pristionchus pacificus]